MGEKIISGTWILGTRILGGRSARRSEVCLQEACPARPGVPGGSSGENSGESGARAEGAGEGLEIYNAIKMVSDVRMKMWERERRNILLSLIPKNKASFSFLHFVVDFLFCWVISLNWKSWYQKESKNQKVDWKYNIDTEHTQYKHSADPADREGAFGHPGVHLRLLFPLLLTMIQHTGVWLVVCHNDLYFTFRNTFGAHFCCNILVFLHFLMTHYNLGLDKLELWIWHQKSWLKSLIWLTFIVKDTLIITTGVTHWHSDTGTALIHWHHNSLVFRKLWWLYWLVWLTTAGCSGPRVWDGHVQPSVGCCIIAVCNTFTHWTTLVLRTHAENLIFTPSEKSIVENVRY